MTQEIIVGLIVALAAAYVALSARALAQALAARAPGPGARERLRRLQRLLQPVQRLRLARPEGAVGS